MAKVLLLGFGRMGSIWHKELTANGHQVQAIVEPNQDLEFPDVSVYSKLDDVAEVGIDWVVDTSPPDQHFGHIQWAYSVGFPMIVEKPMVTSPEELYQVLGMYDKTDLKLFTSQPRRYNNHLAGLHEEIKDHKQIERVHFEVAFPVTPEGWRAKLSHPFAEDMLIHLVDTVRALAGNAMFSEIHCVSSNSGTVTCVGVLEGKIPVTMHGSWSHTSYKTHADGFWMVTTDRGNYRYNGSYILGPVYTVRPEKVRENISGVIEAFQGYLVSDARNYPASYRDNAESLKQVFEVHMQLGLLSGWAK